MIKRKKWITEMEPYDPPLEGRRGKLRLDFNENSIGCSSKVLKALQNITTEDLATYPEYGGFRKKLAKFTSLKESEVLRTNGTDEAISTIMVTYIDKGDDVIIPVPTYAMFRVYAEIAGANIKTVLYEKDLSFPTKAVLRAVTSRTRLVVLVNPNNPTGTPIGRKDIIGILKKAKDALVLVDEAYYEFCGITVKDLVRKYPNLIVIRTFSKAYGLAGLRLGFIMANERIIADLEKVISPYSVNVVAIVAGMAAMEDQAFLRKYVDNVKRERNRVQRVLSEIVIKTYPSSGNFIIASFGDRARDVFDALRKQGILVRDRSRAPLLKGCLRIGIGSREQNDALLRAIKIVLGRRCLLFDMDGVLVDVSDSYRQAILITVEQLSGSKVGGDDIQRIKEKGGFNNDWDTTEQLLIEQGVKEDKQRIIDTFQEIYLCTKGRRGTQANERWLLPIPILKRLRKTYRLGIVTGRPRAEALAALERFGAKKFFDVIVSMEDYPSSKSKPDPYPIRLALCRLKMTEGLYFGDTLDDMKSSSRAGIRGIGVIPPNSSSLDLTMRLRKSGADFVLDDIARIQEVLP